jgi:hypothetical protein
MQMQPPSGGPMMQPPGGMQMKPPSGGPMMQPPGGMQMQPPGSAMMWPPHEEAQKDIYGYGEDTDTTFFSGSDAGAQEPLEIVACYNCNGHIKVFTADRPTKLTCPDCGLESMLED